MLAAKKETASLRQVYDIKTQNLRMKVKGCPGFFFLDILLTIFFLQYEEQLLKVTQPNAHKA